jgi:hypothetical protein
LHSQIKVIIGDEVNVAGLEKCVISRIYFCGLLQYTDRVCITIITEREGEAEHQGNRQDEVPGERSSVAHELAITSLKNGVDSFQHYRYARKE